MTTPHLSKALATFAAELKIGDIPEEVIARTEDLLVDWFGSAIAGKGSRPVETITQFAQNMGGFNNANPGPSEILIHRTNSSPFLAALANAAASHVAEQDDVHNGSVFHPATVVFPAALATAQSIGASGEDLLVAAVAGYEVGIRVGEFLGRSHYKIFHTTGTAGTLAAAAAVGRLLKLNSTQMLHAFGSAGTQSAGLWEFLRDAADSKQLHTAHATSTGLMSAYLAQAGFTGAEHILEGKQGLALFKAGIGRQRLIDGQKGGQIAVGDLGQPCRLAGLKMGFGRDQKDGLAREMNLAGCQQGFVLNRGRCIGHVRQFCRRQDQNNAGCCANGRQVKRQDLGMGLGGKPEGQVKGLAGQGSVVDVAGLTADMHRGGIVGQGGADGHG